MYKFVNKKNVETSKVSFKFCPDYVDRAVKPRLLSDMVDEYTRTGQLPNTCPLRPLHTATEDLDSFSPEYGGADKIDVYNDVQSMMDNIDRLESEKKTKTSKLKEEVAKLKSSERKKLLDELKNMSVVSDK